jgi:hypothetical protein
MRIPICKSAVCVLMTFALLAQVFGATSKPANLVVGTGPVSSLSGWDGYSALNLIPATSVLPVSSTTTVFYLAFTGGTQADISNMVVYTTKGPNNAAISKVTPVTLGGVSNPSIVLTNPSVCPVQPVSVTNPCIVRLDPTTLKLGSANDYWFVVYFTANDSNNASLAAATSAYPNPSITGFYESGDETQLTVGQSVPASSNIGVSYFLLAVMND